MEERYETENIDLPVLSSVILSIQDALFCRNSEGIITVWNPAAEKMFGFAATEVLGGDISIIIPPEHREEEQIIIERLARGERITHFETVRLTKGGQRLYVSISPSPLLDEAGVMTGAVMVARPVVHKPDSGEKHAMLAAIIDSSDDAIVSKNLNGIITSWNKGAERIFGYNEKEAIGKHITLIIPDDLLSEEDYIIAQITAGNKVDHFQTTRERKDGKKIPVSITVSPVRDSSGRVTGASKIARDISHQKQAEEKQAMLAAIVDSSDDVIVSKNLDGIITSWNKGAERVFGYSEEEAIGKHITLIIPEEHRDEENYIISQVASGNKVDHFQTIRVTKDGRKIPVSITVSPVKDSSGRIIGASKIARDISDQIEKTRKLEELNNAKDEFIGIASHELKTPLTSIKANVQVLERKLKDDPIHPFVSRTLQQVNKLSTLISDLLDVSKIQAGKLQFNFHDFEINTIITECIDILQQTVDHELIYQGCSRKIMVKADRIRIEQVIINLLTNAVKYSPKAKKVIVECQMEEDMVVIRVKDFGIGIPKHEQDRIFSRFYRAEGLASVFPGLGIGLYISQEIIYRHKGEMGVTSKEGEGSTFYFRLPVLHVD